MSLVERLIYLLLVFVADSTSLKALRLHGMSYAPEAPIAHG
jgi:hypothetical protein